MGDKKHHYVRKKYQEFYEKHGYIPEMFNAYNCAEITDIAPTVTTCSGIATNSGTILILVKSKED